MKKPEQVAREVLGADALAGVGYEQYIPFMVKAIEADRAQRAEGMLTIELDPEHRPEETVAEVLAQIERGCTSGYYPTWEMSDIDRREGAE